MPKGGSVPAATEITKPPVVPQAQERKPQVAYKTEIIGGVVVHTPISINQVSWQDPCTLCPSLIREREQQSSWRWVPWPGTGERRGSDHGAGGSCWFGLLGICTFISGKQLDACTPFPLRGL